MADVTKVQLHHNHTAVLQHRTLWQIHDEEGEYVLSFSVSVGLGALSEFEWENLLNQVLFAYRHGLGTGARVGRSQVQHELRKSLGL